MIVAVNETIVAEVSHSMEEEGAKVPSALRIIYKERSLSFRVKLGMFQGIVVQIVLYGYKA